MLTLHTLIQTVVCYLYASFNSFERLRLIVYAILPYSPNTSSIYLIYKFHRNSITYTPPPS